MLHLPLEGSDQRSDLTRLLLKCSDAIGILCSGRLSRATQRVHLGDIGIRHHTAVAADQGHERIGLLLSCDGLVLP